MFKLRKWSQNNGLRALMTGFQHFTDWYWSGKFLLHIKNTKNGKKIENLKKKYSEVFHKLNQHRSSLCNFRKDLIAKDWENHFKILNDIWTFHKTLHQIRTILENWFQPPKIWFLNYFSITVWVDNLAIIHSVWIVRYVGLLRYSYSMSHTVWLIQYELYRM